MTTARSQMADLLKTWIAGDYAAAERKAEALSAANPSHLIHATFFILVERRFPAAEAQQVTQFVTHARERFPDLQAMYAEALVRAALGESDLVDGLDPDVVVPTELLLVYQLTADAGMTDEELDTLLTEAAQLSE